ncbi:MAG: hypothetical protein Q8911_00460 [Bacillota bacterium]|nr:hypothetical protein [Bacillota bacterium]
MGFRETIYYDDEGKETGKKKIYLPDRFDDKKGYLFWNQTNFVKTFQDVELPKELRKVDIANLFLLSKKVYADTNMIGYRGNGGSPRPMTINQMSEVIKDTERHTTTFIKRMIKARIIAKIDVKIGDDKTIQYYFNPIYFFSSNRLSLNLYALFQKDLDPFLSNYAKQRFSKLMVVK